ncbi:MAG: hypothetical protein ABUT20_26115 [Bacteroidota bacterium]
MSLNKLQTLSVAGIKTALTVEVLNYLDASANDEALEIKKAIRVKIKSLLENIRGIYNNIPSAII